MSFVSRKRRLARVARSIALWTAVISGLLWALSHWRNVGFGVHFGATGGWGPRRADVEASLVPGGFLAIFQGTRTDGIYEGPTSYTTYGDTFYWLDVGQITAPVVIWPRLRTPGIPAGHYCYVPWWMVTVSSMFGVWWFRPKPDALNGLCSECGYSRAGIPFGTPCPECGTSPKRGVQAPGAS